VILTAMLLSFVFIVLRNVVIIKVFVVMILP